MFKKNYLCLPLIAAFALIGAIANPSDAELIAHYEFEGNFEDSSGNGLHGVPNGNPEIVFDEARNSNVLSLDGASVIMLDGWDFFQADVDFLEEITMTMWVNTNVDLSGVSFSGGMNTDWSMGGFHFKINNGLVNVGINGGGADVVGETILPVGEWHHIAVTASWDEIAVYYDGVKEGSRVEITEFPVIDMGLNPVIGGWDNNGNIERIWNGLKDDIRIYNVALSEEEIMDLFEATSPTKVESWSVY